MHPVPATPIAPYSTRHRLALSGLFIAWLLAAVFFFLGWRAHAQSPPGKTGGTTATHEPARSQVAPTDVALATR